MVEFIKRYLQDESAAVMPMAALLMPVILLMAGLGTDTSAWMMARRNLQTAADAAALAGAWEAARGGTDYIQSAALKEAINNDYDPAEGGELTVVYDSDQNKVYVTLTQNAGLFLTRIIMSNPVRTTVEAEATISNNEGDYCILSLNDVQASSMTTSGNVDLVMPDCGIAVNSSNGRAFSMNGNVNIDVKDVSIVGDYDIHGGSANFQYENLITGGSPVPDPYANYEPDEDGYSSCDYNNTRVNRGGSQTLTPGRYCGGLRISGTNNITFEPGVYIIDGGTFDVSGNGSMYGDGVTFILTGSGNDYATADITGGKNIEFHAPDAGEPNVGLVFYQDPNAPSSGTNNLLGNANLYIDGVAYFPSQELNIGGTSASTSDVCTHVIADTVIIHGTPFIGNDCSDSAAEPIGHVSVRLTG